VEPAELTRLTEDPAEHVLLLLRTIELDGDLITKVAEGVANISRRDDPIGARLLRRHILVVDPHRAESSGDVLRAFDGSLTQQALHQRKKVLEGRIRTVVDTAGQLETVRYIAASFGRLGRLDDQADWVRRLCAVAGAADDLPWGTPCDIALVLVSAAFAGQRLVDHEGSLWFIASTGDARGDVTAALTALADEFTLNGPLWCASTELDERLRGAGVAARSVVAVRRSLVDLQRILEVGDMCVVFSAAESRTLMKDGREKRGGRLEDRIAAVIRLVPDVDTDRLIDLFVEQHRHRNRGSVENAMRACRQAMTPRRASGPT
jgi:hypothetical protein